ncbi:MAG TPA: hypothetical protein VF170_01430, partial [Planctomycetaceae bacterium]
MRHSIWKLTAVVGISGLGFLVILQVQKGLHDAGTVQAAELEPDAAKGPTGGTKAASKPSTPGKVRLKLEPPETAAAKAASAGL